ncbi:NAD(P)H-quinone oxidoreductase [Pseudomonas sichuanensis]|uniref:NAD(P)H-quinone oxidoreductase n=1 Tax=Pseudomonas sichuanensis TaxID=2213015 RepID=UPI00244CF877|nr:NAD(P)H-quinone oxidoreductase [Pseudomonas sichuanensis]MDH0733014.1 NAD(P)H-quinone oxidoreductase [Pseudomonas sichuanensis]MDH1585356.1 NAD(P)H-quinone oxidoreductase [Pseudomonas sichuanensis]MDH1593132.1 NAD(P)H-quinone oxidoreductase [Pseudomonas sichuanensis]MDH1600653.1 NAD(P)H-quinone oxidoreductase [Pseudomonas sichuanensis]
MTAIEITQPGEPQVLQPTTRDMPRPGPREVLIEVHAAGVNGPDLLQRKGLYDPPAGASDIPGLEIAGKVVALGEQVSQFALGDAVLALVTGGGYAEYAVADERTTAHLPQGLSMIEAAALPETFMTVWVNLFQRGGFKAGDSILIHGGASGIGTTATQLAKAFGATQIFTTVKDAAQQAASLALGADVAIDYTCEDFVEQVMLHTAGKGVDVIVDIIAGDYVARNFQAAAMDGRIVQIGVIKGPASEVNLFPMLTKRLTHIGSTLRARSADDKAAILADLQAQVWHQVHSGAVKPLIHATLPLAAASQAHALMESGRHIGKVVLSVAHEG